jgi:hypothetical protein
LVFPDTQHLPWGAATTFLYGLHFRFGLDGHLKTVQSREESAKCLDDLIKPVRFENVKDSELLMPEFLFSVAVSLGPDGWHALYRAALKRFQVTESFCQPQDPLTVGSEERCRPYI